jgi:gluconolactonase
VTHFVRSPDLGQADGDSMVTNVAFSPASPVLVMTDAASASVLVAQLPAKGLALYSHHR